MQSSNVTIQQAIDLIMQKLDQIGGIQKAMAIALKDECPPAAERLRFILEGVAESVEGDGVDASMLRSVLGGLSQPPEEPDPQPSPKLRLVQ